jgi:peptide/nickel transport system substrate-binding protein
MGILSRRELLVRGGTTAAALAAGSALAACGASSPSATKSKTTGGVLQAGVSAAPSNLDPDVFEGGEGTYFFGNVFERLYQDDQSGAVVPWLATSHTISPDGRTFTFNLRPDVYFHDGSHMTADDVVFSFKRFITPTSPDGFLLAANFAGAEALSPTQVAVHLKEYDAAFLAFGGYTYILPQAYISRVGGSGFAAHPVGTGPFSFGGQVINSYYNLDRFNKYWGSKPGFSSVKMNIISSDSTRVSELQAGQVSLISQVPPSSVASLKGSSGITVKSVVDGDAMWIAINTLKKDVPWLKTEVRQAMAHAVDSAAILKAIAFGQGQLYAGVLPSEPGFAQSNLRQVPYDPAKAKALLAAAGYPNGFTITFAAPVNGRVPYSEQIAQAVAGYWQAVGIDTKVTIQSYDQWIKSTNPGTPFDSWFVVFGALAPDPQFRLTASLTTGGPISAVADSHLDALITAVVQNRDPASRETDIDAAFAYAMGTQAYQIPLFEASETYAYNTSAVSWNPWVGQAAAILQNVRPA